MDNKSPDAGESTVRNLRKKLDFLIERVALRKKSDFKNGNIILIPLQDAAIVRNILACAVGDKEYEHLMDWFNGSLDIDDADSCMMLELEMKEAIMRAEMTGEADPVTVDEWIATVHGVINYDMAKKTSDIKRKLEAFRTRTLVLDNTVRAGDVYRSYTDGSREYILPREDREKHLEQKQIDDLLQDLYTQDDYFSVLNQILDAMMADAEKKALPFIEVYAKGKNLSGCNSAFEMIQDDEQVSMISEYIPWFRKIAKFLKRNPEEVKRIEKECETQDLIKFFSE